jgi:hypothetical protein
LEDEMGKGGEDKEEEQGTTWGIPNMKSAGMCVT